MINVVFLSYWFRFFRRIKNIDIIILQKNRYSYRPVEINKYYGCYAAFYLSFDGLFSPTVSPRSLVHFHIVNRYIKEARHL